MSSSRTRINSMDDDRYYQDEQADARAAEDAAKREAEKKQTRWKKLLSTPEGKDVARDILNRCKLFHSTFRRNAEGAYLEGRRSIGLEVLADMLAADKRLAYEVLAAGLDDVSSEPDD